MSMVILKTLLCETLIYNIPQEMLDLYPLSNRKYNYILYINAHSRDLSCAQIISCAVGGKELCNRVSLSPSSVK